MATDLELLVRDKYEGDTAKVTDEDTERLAAGEPLAYVIGWIPFLGLRINLDSKPLIPRPETEWWTEQLVAHLRERFGDTPFTFLDLCAGSGAIGLAILHVFPTAHVTFAELIPTHADTIKKNIALNNLNATRATIYTGDLFTTLPTDMQFDIIATNPPYIPEARALDASVTSFEPHEALFAGEDGLGLIRRIATEAPARMRAGGELWLECDSEHADVAKELLEAGGAERATLSTDLYGRPRLVVAYYGQ